MNVRITKIAISLAFAVPAGYVTAHVVRTVSVSDVLETVLFYGDLPDPYQRRRDQTPKRFRSG